jgi:hypothetical protein
MVAGTRGAQLHQNKQLAVWDGSFGLVIWNAAVVITRMLEDEQHRRYLLGGACDALSDEQQEQRRGRGRGRQLTVLDVGAGSGLAGLSLGKYLGKSGV